MKKYLAFTAAVALVASLQANIIDWSLPTLTDGNGNDIDYSMDDIVFISTTASGIDYDSVSGKITGVTPSGSNTLIDEDTTDKYIAATWTDTLSAPQTYYMAYKGSDGSYYALEDSGAAYQVTVSGGGDPLIPGSGTGSAFRGDDADTVKTVAPAVPEPATAVLALAGIAMLIRRRKA